MSDIELDERGLVAAIRECARITAPEISDETFERHRAKGTTAFNNTSYEVGRIITAYLTHAQDRCSELVIPLSAAIAEAEKLGFLSVEDLRRLSTTATGPVAHAYVVDGKCEEISWGGPKLSNDPSTVLLYASPACTHPAPAVPDAVEAEVRRRLRWIAEARHDDNADLDAICTYADQALAALAASHMQVGDGYVLVPKEPTEAMLYADPGTCTTHAPAYRRALWSAMLAASTGEAGRG